MNSLIARRNTLRALAGLSAAGFITPNLLSEAVAQQDRRRSSMMQTIEGDIRINDKPAAVGQSVRSGDTIATGPGGYAVWTLDGDAFLLRQNSRIQISGTQTTVNLFRMVTGKVLAVFEKGRTHERTVSTITATIGIRGTGVYTEAFRDRTYLCLCYGKVDVESRAGAKESLVSSYHESPRVIFGDGRPSPMIKGPIVNHSDAELIMLESLLDRKPPEEFLKNVRY